MHFANIRDLRASAASVLRDRGEETVVVTYRGKPVALLVPVHESQLEQMMQAVKAARLRASVEKLRAHARKTGADRMSMAEIDRVIKTARGSRRA